MFEHVSSSVKRGLCSIISRIKEGICKTYTIMPDTWYLLNKDLLLIQEMFTELLSFQQRAEWQKTVTCIKVNLLFWSILREAVKVILGTAN